MPSIQVVGVTVSHGFRTAFCFLAYASLSFFWGHKYLSQKELLEVSISSCFLVRKVKDFCELEKMLLLLKLVI